MTWAEFCIRSHAFKRIDKDDWYKVREIAYYAMIGSHLDSKKLPKTKNEFIYLDEPKSAKPNEDILNVMKQARERYQKELKLNRND